MHPADTERDPSIGGRADIVQRGSVVPQTHAVRPTERLELVRRGCRECDVAAAHREEAAEILFLYATRFIAGMGIGGEYAAINSGDRRADPARYRGRIDIAVNGTYWFGAILGTLGTLILLNVLRSQRGLAARLPDRPGAGAVHPGAPRHLPESPRWQIMHGREKEAQESIDYIEKEVTAGGQQLPEVDDSKAIELRPERSHGYIALLRVLFKTYPKRSILGATLMITQSFLYNSIFFTYTLVLGKFYGVPASSAPWFLIAFAVGNFIGPLALGHLFDTLGRRKMIAGTYILSGVLLAISAWLFNAGLLNAITQTIAWCVIFFFASAGASAAYLTVSEIFPLEVRAMAIAVFFAIAQGFGALGPVLYGALIGDGSNPTALFYGYLLAAGIMIIGGLVEVGLGIDAENKSLEDVAEPLSVAGA